jgi:hypothetical protein
MVNGGWLMAATPSLFVSLGDYMAVVEIDHVVRAAAGEGGIGEFVIDVPAVILKKDGDAVCGEISINTLGI